MFVISCVRWIPVLTVQFLTVCMLYTYLLVSRRWKTDSWIHDSVKFLSLILLMLYEISFMRTVVTLAPPISSKYQSTAVEFVNLDMLSRLSIFTRTSSKDLRYCKKCMTLQPDRAYHCEECQTCVPKMDHHCYWMNNCIHFWNLKFFILCQWYGAATCLTMAVSSALLLVEVQSSKVTVKSALDFYTIMPMLLVMFLSLCCLTLFYLHLIFRNQTLMERALGIYLENGRRYDRLFHLGWKKNFSEVFGECSFLTFLPIFTSKGNGEVFKISIEQGDTHELDELSPSLA